MDTLEVVAGKAVAACKKAENYQAAAAVLLAECRARVAAGEYDGNWTKFRLNFLDEIGERRIQQLIKIGKAPDPEQALAESREATRIAVQNTREKQKAAPALRNSGLPRPSSDEPRPIALEATAAPTTTGSNLPARAKILRDLIVNVWLFQADGDLEAVFEEMVRTNSISELEADLRDGRELFDQLLKICGKMLKRAAA